MPEEWAWPTCTCKLLGHVYIVYVWKICVHVQVSFYNLNELQHALTCMVPKLLLPIAFSMSVTESNWNIFYLYIHYMYLIMCVHVHGYINVNTASTTTDIILYRHFIYVIWTSITHRSFPSYVPRVGIYICFSSKAYVPVPRFIVTMET